MKSLTKELNLEDFLELLSLDTKLLKNCSKEELEEYRNKYLLILNVFSSSYGNLFTKLFRSAVIGKASSLNGVILKLLGSLPNI